MNKFAVFLVIFLLVLLQIPSFFGSTVGTPVIEDFILETNNSQVIERGNHIVSGGLFLDGNSSLTFLNTEITFGENEEGVQDFRRQQTHCYQL